MSSSVIGSPLWDDDFYEDSLVCRKCKKEISMDDLREHIKNHDSDYKTITWLSILNFYKERWEF